VSGEDTHVKFWERLYVSADVLPTTTRNFAQIKNTFALCELLMKTPTKAGRTP